jgi:hypothetical protein
MPECDAKLTDLQYLILDGMADDYENLEQLYLYANRDLEKEERLGVEFPLKIHRDLHALHTVIDEVAAMLNEGYIEVKYSNDENFAPLEPLNFTLLHHYWFGPTAKGLRAWETRRQAASGA